MASLPSAPSGAASGQRAVGAPVQAWQQPTLTSSDFPCLRTCAEQGWRHPALRLL